MKRPLSIRHGSESVDSAPDGRNVVLRRDGVEYYTIETFHSSPFYNAVTPVLVVDLVRAVDPYDIYGHGGHRLVRDNVVLLKNHPVRRVRVTGWISDYTMKEIRQMMYYFLSLDDSSGEAIKCMVRNAVLEEAGLEGRCEGSLVEIVGVCSKVYGELEIKANALKLLPRENHLTYELQFWSEVFRVRRVLETPWYQTPQLDADNGDEPPVRMDATAQRRKYMERNMVLSSPHKDYPPLVLDSSIYTKRTVLNESERRKRADDQDLSSSSDIEEITSDVFANRPRQLRTESVQVLPESVLMDSVSVDDLMKRQQGPSVSDLTILLTEWIVDNGERHFHLNKAYQDPLIRDYLKTLAENELSAQVVDLTEDTTGVKSLNQVHGELFHRARHLLQRSGLILCTRSKECSSGVLIDFIVQLQDEINLITTVGSIFDPREVLAVFNKTRHLDVDIEDPLLQSMMLRYVSNSRQHSKWYLVQTTGLWLFM
ncbi:uncharacterized protein CYBJADRAFT_172340 [Cyberlindnera jadinii NRRL Y-1542]|uniref:CST complex subunit Stn1 N-terminal domain-containing protein n=1 Tax=Cyberlindnera jadinii (strain ATCC 18201 / CBS 1600 / BCRC 20928 / JCM 3617 / NBRC 0987 / NRRL Y-1542) TaxID=983966 RepID=A0A1E4S4I9_CYBJN|nr:hypothetical protein CYBJADRAFT_172340 [Cyberlindnera jadinii NRRL Y-1542]ODV74360.1 hypothetical protein CYBJADRAFT_172340 [Cyberlindnera jadinii NRRL Y-1542]